MDKKRLFIFGLAIFFLFSFYLFSRQVKHGFLKQEDFNFTVVLQNHVPARFDALWDELALPVTPTPSIIVIIIITFILFIKEKSWKKRLAALAIPVLFGLLVLGETYGKTVVHHPAPPFFMIKNSTTIFPQFYINEQFSYPSGHTSRAVFIAIVVWLLAKKRRNVGIALLAWVGLIALGRIYLGSHWLSDVIGGGLLGCGLGLLTLLV
jgi:membrane-associated phospholipid phosphatase